MAEFSDELTRPWSQACGAIASRRHRWGEILGVDKTVVSSSSCRQSRKRNLRVKGMPLVNLPNDRPPTASVGLVEALSISWNIFFWKAWGEKKRLRFSDVSVLIKSFTLMWLLWRESPRLIPVRENSISCGRVAIETGINRILTHKTEVDFGLAQQSQLNMAVLFWTQLPPRLMEILPFRMPSAKLQRGDFHCLLRPEHQVLLSCQTLSDQVCCCCRNDASHLAGNCKLAWSQHGMSGGFTLPFGVYLKLSLSRGQWLWENEVRAL